ncbi:MAG: glucan biosynthesis protein, partial [Halofilum sp. (in: g-proteobacteria)]
MARSFYPDPQRRAVLGALAALPCLGLPRILAADDQAPDLGPAEPFDFNRLIERARELSQRDHSPVQPKAPELLDRIGYDEQQRIQYRPSAEINAGGHYGVRAFHLGSYAQEPVVLHLVEDGQARRIQYDRRLFAYDEVQVSSELPPDLGFSGFRIMHPDGARDWMAYQGASYFRSAGPLDQYGLSARGIAIDTAYPGGSEEFPRFTTFWVELSGETVIIYALLDGPSVTGAYRFDCRKGGEAITQDVRAEIFQRDSVERLGIAPLTSMYWYAEQERGPDWRPEIHDSDGLAMWTGSGERIWRPLNNPPSLQVNSYLDENPRGFGLLQRDRRFANYQDDGVWYNRRPSVWVEPKGDWGRGRVQLFELPTDDETHDNINCYWVPEESAEAG